ncbi:hypothetical protein D3C77_482410 [compost metagenome]
MHHRQVQPADSGQGPDDRNAIIRHGPPANLGADQFKLLAPMQTVPNGIQRPLGNSLGAVFAVGIKVVFSGQDPLGRRLADFQFVAGDQGVHQSLVCPQADQDRRRRVQR